MILVDAINPQSHLRTVLSPHPMSDVVEVCDSRTHFRERWAACEHLPHNISALLQHTFGFCAVDGSSHKFSTGCHRSVFLPLRFQNHRLLARSACIDTGVKLLDVLGLALLLGEHTVDAELACKGPTLAACSIATQVVYLCILLSMD